MQQSFDLFDPRLKNDPRPLLKRLAGTRPFLVEINGVESLILCRHRDIEIGYSDYERFSSEKPHIKGQEGIDYFNGKKIIAFADPPEHTRLRRGLARNLSPAAVKSLKDEIDRVIEKHVLALEPDGGKIEIVNEFADGLANQLVLGVVLGLPATDFDVFLALTHEMCRLGELQPGDKHPVSYFDAWERAEAYLENVIGGDNTRIDKNKVIYSLVTQNDEDRDLSSEELLLQIMPLCVAGISPVKSFISSAMLTLASHKPQYHLLRESRELLGQAVDEIIRYDPPSVFSPRYVRNDCRYEGLALTRGLPVYLIVGAAGFDTALYRDPMAFDITRQSRTSVFFGKGIHTCLGKHFVKLVGQLTLEKFTLFYPDIELWNPDWTIHYTGSPQARDPEAVYLRLAG